MQAETPVLLVVEDDLLVRLTLVDALSDGGFEVVEAADAKEALTLVCDRDDIAAMLTDINLPGGSDGFALARAARVIRPHLPVVYASGRYGGAAEGQQAALALTILSHGPQSASPTPGQANAIRRPGYNSRAPNGRSASRRPGRRGRAGVRAG
jgi:CheY-like chemotaxis protein